MVAGGEAGQVHSNVVAMARPAGLTLDSVPHVAPVAMAVGRNIDALLVATLTRELVDVRGHGVVVSVDRPLAGLLDGLATAQVPPEALRIVCCSDLPEALPTSPFASQVTHLGSPALLELVAVRSLQILGRTQGPAFILIDSLSALAMHNGVGAAVEFAQHLAARCRDHDVRLLFLLADGPHLGQMLHELGPTCDFTIAI